MKRRFTILTAALALLTFLAVPMGMWGQTTVTWPGTTALPGTATAVANDPNITIKVSSTNTYTNPIRVYANTTITINALNGTKIIGVTYEASSTGNYVTYAQNATVTPSVTPSVSGKNVTWTYAESANVTEFTFKPTSQTRTNGISITYITDGSSSTPSMSLSTNSIDFGSVAINPSSAYTETFDVTFANLTENLTIAGFTGVTVSPTSIAYNATSPQTVTVSYNPSTVSNLSGNIIVSNTDDEVSETVAVTGSAYDPANIDTYERYTGALVEGDYIICANAEVAMKNVISGNRFENEAVTVTDNAITNPDASIIWHIAPDGDYWTIYNAAVNKYAAGTNSNNQGTLLDAVTDHARWNITYQYSNYTVICYGRNSSSNKYLRRNGDYGWATYANSTGQVPTFYKKVATNQVVMPTFSPVEGTYFETQSVTLSCTTDGATIYYTTDGTTPSASNGTEYTTAISVSSTMTIKAIAVKEGMADSDVATAQYTIELPLSTMDQIFAKATEVGNTATDVRIAFDNWVVTGANNSSHTFVTDGTKGFMIYQSNHGFAAGDILSGTVQCRVQLYNGVAEITNLTSSTTGLTVTTGGNVTIADIDMADLNGINTGALVSYQNLTCEARVDGSYTNYYLSDGTTEIQAYKTLLDNYADYLEDGKTYNITGVFVLNNSTKRINPRSADDIVEVEVQHEEYTLTVSNLSHVNLFIFGGEESETIISTEDGETTAQVYDGTEVLVSIDVEAGYVFQSLTITDGNGAPVETEELTANEYYSFLMPTSNVTITATAVEYVAPVGGDYVRITSLNQLTDGSKVIIAARHDEQHTNEYYAMQNATSNKPEGTLFTSVTSGNDEAVASTITDDEDNYYWTVNVTENGYTFTNANDQMIGYSNSTNFATDNNTEWTIERAEAGNNAMVPGYEGFVIKNGTTTTRAFAFNGSVFGAYSTSNMNAAGYNFFLDFFVQQEAAETETYTLTITGYSGQKDHYSLIASPVTVDPATVTDMTTGDYDLYYFEENPAVDQETGIGLEWINYQDTNNGGGFKLVPGKGYLYAKKTANEISTYTFQLTGTPYAGNGTVELNYTQGAEFSGWNLIGNPFGTNATLDKPYYRLNQDGSALNTSTESGQINVMEGVFVQALASGTTANFTQATGSKRISQLNVKVTCNRSAVLDNAIIRFDDGATLGKFQLNQNDTKVYFTEGNQDFAVVRSNNAGEMPVSFKAAENGNYTLSVEAENVEASYLHLIDNMTGADVDLLATPSYSFEARTTDYANRFRLVFNANGVDENNATASFAYFNGSSWTVSNMGEATLQVVDMMGRVVSTQAISGNTDVNLNQVPGVYMLRLVNGENVMVQKVVVR